MSNARILTVGQDGGDIVGNDNAAIQCAVDCMAEHGGGTVEIGPGTYELHDSLHLRSGVTIRGAGPLTVLRKAPMVGSRLSNDAGYGMFDIAIAEPEKFRVGQGVFISDDTAFGFYTTVAKLTWRDGERFGIDSALTHDYWRKDNAVVKTLFPVVSGYYLENAVLEDLTIDGNLEANEVINGCRGAGVFLYQASNVTLRRLIVQSYNGEGIGFQQTKDILVEDCVVRDNTGNGLHPGSGTVGAIMRRVHSTENGGAGLYFCLRVTYSLVEACLLEANGGSGISINNQDTDHVLRGNTIRGNGGPGIDFWPGDAATAGQRCLVEANLLENNCVRDGAGEIMIDGETRDVNLIGNTIRPRSSAIPGIVTGPNTSRIVVSGDSIPESPLADPLADPLAAGPSAAPSYADRHLYPRLGESLQFAPNAVPISFPGKQALAHRKATCTSTQDC